ncbi:MAG TPA: hypothetical protein ENI69_09020 [Rhodospirillales bacterium]|nr:hypothetical protein [Rhodospirillales bacterium]
MSDIKLSLENSSGNRQNPESGHPIAGYLALLFGLLGIFSVGYVFVPLTFIAAIVALFAGQIIWGIFGMLLGFAGLLTSPVLLAFLGMAWLLALF